MSQIQNLLLGKRVSKRYNLEGKILGFTRSVGEFVKKPSKIIGDMENSNQLTKASGSVGTHYIETNATLNKKDFIHRIKFLEKKSKRKRILVAIS